MPIQSLSECELVRLYGPWAGRTPADGIRLLEGYPGRWWVAGGWAIEAFTGVVREHGDLDLEIPRRELPLLRRHLAARLDVWTAAGGSLKPLLPEETDADPETVLPEGCGQVWLRLSGQEPWEYDVLLTPGTGDVWEYKRDSRIRRPWSDVLWSSDGVSYLRPEVQLLLKAKGLRPKDQRDFDATVQLLDTGSISWLRDALELAHPGHPWSAALG